MSASFIAIVGRESESETLSAHSGLRAQIPDIVETVLHSNTVWVAGSGASEVAGEKFAHSLRTLGIRAASLSLESLFHGDIGGVQSDDLLFLVSRSGAGSNLRLLCKMLTGVAAKKILLTENSAVEAGCFDVVCLPRTAEGDFLGLIPTLSFQACVEFLDQVVISLADRIGPGYGATFARIHPGGGLGSRLATPAREVLELPQPEIIESAALETSALEELEEKLNRSRVGGVCVCEPDGTMLGIITDGDVRRMVLNPGSGGRLRLSEVRQRGFVRIQAGGSVAEIFGIFSANPHISVAPLVSEGDVPVAMFPARLLPKMMGALER